MRHAKKSPVKSWSIIVDPLAPAREGERSPAPSPTSESRRQPTPTSAYQGIRTTGLWPVPSGSGNIITLIVTASSFSHREETVAITVYQRSGDERTPLFSERWTLPPGGAREAAVEGVEHQSIEVTVDPSSEHVHPSAAVTETFRADGAVVVLAYRSPADFILV